MATKHLTATGLLYCWQSLIGLGPKTDGLWVRPEPAQKARDRPFCAWFLDADWPGWAAFLTLVCHKCATGPSRLCLVCWPRISHTELAHDTGRRPHEHVSTIQDNIASHIGPAEPTGLRRGSFCVKRVSAAPGVVKDGLDDDLLRSHGDSSNAEDVWSLATTVAVGSDHGAPRSPLLAM